MISIIVPVYNVEKYLRRCVESICCQSYRELEIILVDDGSTDTSGAICDCLAKEDARIQVVHKENGGLSSARNAGLDIASGEYIGFVDSDDWVEPEMYKELYTAMEAAKAELAVTGIRRVYESGYAQTQFISKNSEVYHGSREIVKRYFQQNAFSTAAWDKLYKRELFQNVRFPVGKLYEDAPVIYQILCSINTMVNIGKARYNYFQRSSSICGQSFSARKMDHYYFSKQIYEDALIRFPELTSEARVFWGCKLCEIIYAIAESDNRRAFYNELRLLRKHFCLPSGKVLLSKTVYPIVKLKVFLSVLHMEKLYLWIKGRLVHK